MTRATRPGSIQDAVRQAFGAVGGLENAAADLGLSLSVLSYGTELREDRPGGLGVNYLDRLGRIESAAAEAIARHFAALAGGVFQPIDPGGVLWADVHALTREFSDVLQLHAEAHGQASRDPTDYTPEEARAQVREIDGLVVAALRLRAAMILKAECDEARSSGASPRHMNERVQRSKAPGIAVAAKIDDLTGRSASVRSHAARPDDAARKDRHVKSS